MKLRIAVTTLLTLVCLTLAGIPAMAIDFNTGGPELPDLVGTKIGSGQVGETQIVDVSWFCPNPAGCLVQSMNFWAFNGSTGAIPDPVSLQWLLSGSRPFDFKGGTQGEATSFNNLGCLQAGNGANVCNFSFDFPNGGVVAPTGINWLNLYKFDNGRQAGDINWSNSDGTGQPSTTLILSLDNIITDYPSSLAFGVHSEAVPEPGSMLLLGSGLLGAVGYARRRFISS